MSSLSPKYTACDWKKNEASLKKLSTSTQESAYSVLVEGKKVSDVAKERNLKRQTIYAACKKVDNILKELSLKKEISIIVEFNEDKLKEVEEFISRIGGKIVF